MKDFFNEDFTLKKEIEEDTEIWNDLPCSWLSKINILKVSLLPKVIYRFNAIFIKIPMSLFTEMENSSKIYMEMQNTQNSQCNSEGENINAGVITTPNFKLIYRAILTKSSWHWHQNRHTIKWNIRFHCSQLVLTQRKKTNIGEKSLFN